MREPENGTGNGTRMSVETPNAEDPLSEPTVNRRMWAAYLSRGHSRAEFARMLGVNYNAVQNWDRGDNQMSLDTFLKACQLLNYSSDEIGYGRRSNVVHHNANSLFEAETVRAMPVGSRSILNISRVLRLLAESREEDIAPFLSNESTSAKHSPEYEAATKVLSNTELREVFERLNASPEARHALATADLSLEYHWLVDRTENWVTHFVRAWDTSQKLKPTQRMIAAVNTATNAAARLKAIALDGHEPRDAPPPPPPRRQRKRTPMPTGR